MLDNKRRKRRGRKAWSETAHTISDAVLYFQKRYNRKDCPFLSRRQKKNERKKEKKKKKGDESQGAWGVGVGGGGGGSRIVVCFLFAKDVFKQLIQIRLYFV